LAEKFREVFSRVIVSIKRPRDMLTYSFPTFCISQTFDTAIIDRLTHTPPYQARIALVYTHISLLFVVCSSFWKLEMLE